MTHTAACNIRNPAYRHKTYTPAPISSAAENVTVKAITSFRYLFGQIDAASSGVEAAVRLAAQPARPEPALLAHAGPVGQRATHALKPAAAPVQLASHAHHLLSVLVSFP
jgi:hypothetical protein